MSEMIKWVEKLIDNYNEFDSLEVFSGSVKLTGHAGFKRILLSKGLEIVADELGVEVNEQKTNDEMFPCILSFKYKGFEFVQFVYNEDYIPDAE